MTESTVTRRVRLLLAVAALALPLTGLGCQAGVVGDETAASDPSYATHDEPSDFVVDADDGKADGVPATFTRNTIVDESFFLASDALDADEVQEFFEETPYGSRCFLADEMVGDLRASDALVNAATYGGVNPIVLLARLQVEKSLISKSVRPSNRTVNFALGCGCPDDSGCNDSYAGLANQLECAADTFSSLHEMSVDGSGWWRAGKSRETLDGYWVKSTNHATAAMYGYTPWVLPGSGGNWLVWNVTRKYVKHFRGLGIIE